jgi:hypothetical protein
MYDRVYNNVPVAGAVAKNRVLIGEGRGSMYNVSWQYNELDWVAFFSFY